MKKLYGLAILMAAVLLAIAGFQVYWIRDNYSREQKAAEVRAQAIFRETVREVQDAVLQKKIKILLRDTASVTAFKKSTPGGPLKLRSAQPKTARVLHLLGEQMRADSNKKKTGVFIRVNSGGMPRKDTAFNGASGKEMFVETSDVKNVATESTLPPGQVARTVVSQTEANDSLIDKMTEVNAIYFNTREGNNFRIVIDSLYSDPVSLHELNQAYSKKLAEQKLDIPFSIAKAPHQMLENTFLKRPLVLDDFEGYKLELGNPVRFLIKKISVPILFSVFLVGLSVLSFVLLYRSLLRQHRLAGLKNDLISNITHELKTPIATVAVAIEALKNFNAIQDPDKTREYLDISQNELQRLELLVDKVLKLSMFENKAIEIKKEMVDLEQVVKEVVNSLRLQLEKENADIQINVKGNLLVSGDRLHLVSVVFNLLDNALKYNKGKVSIRVDLTEEEDHVVLNIADDGVGIPQQYTSKVFDKFFRVPTGNTHNAKGHGLGLSYVSQVVRQHRGSIKVESTPGDGSSFTITLPKSTSHQSCKENG